ncbi:MAG: hypothetical protein IJ760_02500 [Bacteroidales bacterium]|nr:hypothetical protein [Bacteroidales bacterium]
MKKLGLLLFAVVAAYGLKAQSCDSILMSRFGGDRDLIASYPQEKIDFYCAFAHSAFYVTDTMPENAVVRSLSEVKRLSDGVALPLDYVVDLEHLIYYDYNFEAIQSQYTQLKDPICFPTPASDKKYLILRSYLDMLGLASDFVESDSSYKVTIK